MSTMLRYASTLGLVLSLMLGLSSWANANTVSGELKFLDEFGCGDDDVSGGGHVKAAGHGCRSEQRCWDGGDGHGTA